MGDILRRINTGGAMKTKHICMRLGRSIQYWGVHSDTIPHLIGYRKELADKYHVYFQGCNLRLLACNWIIIIDLLGLPSPPYTSHPLIII